MSDLLELRCTCSGPGGKHPKLAEIEGKDFVLRLRCPKCKRLITFTYPHPLGKPTK